MKAAMMLSIFDGKPPPAGSAPSSGRPNAGEILTPRTPLLLRGHTMERSAAADGERRGSGISHSASALLQGSSATDSGSGSGSSLHAAASASDASLRRESSIRLPAFNMNNVLAAGDDELDGLLTPRSGGQSSRLATTREAAGQELTAVAGLPLCVAVTPQQRAPLVLQAALALWQLRDQARGFRKWKDVLAEPLDLSAQLPALPPGVAAADEARRLLLNAETKRQIAMVRHQSSSVGGNASAGQAQAAASFSRAESNLLLLWAREAHAKSFRDVDDLTLREVVRHLRLRQYQDGEPLFFEGDAGDQFYLLLDGTVAVYSGASAAAKHRLATSRPAQARDGKPAAVEDLAALGRRVFTYRAGESFGETSMFTKDAARTASAVAAGACEVLELAKDVYLRTLKRFHRQYYERARRLHFAQRVPLFREWPRPRVAAVAEALELRKLSFGDRLLIEGVVAPAACFLVLSGALKLTTQVALDDTDDGDEHRGNQGGAASSPRRRPPDSTGDDHGASSRKRPEQRRRHGGAAVTIALHSARAGEFVALEAVLHPGSRARYSAVADAADVEVYALAESDARALLGGAGSVVYQQLRLMADAAATQHRQRLDAARRALQDRRQPPLGLARLDEGGFCDAALLGGEGRDGDRLEGAAQTPAEAAREQEQRQRSRAVAAEHTTYVPHLDTSRLLAAATGASASLGAVAPCSPLLSADGKWLAREDKLDPDVSAVAPPRMLSTCVKNFVFANSDTLASDYVERLALQFPLASPRQPHAFLLSTSPDGGVAAASVTARPTESPSFGSPNHHHRRTRPQQQQQQQQLLGQHMRRLYETKMHWDATRKSFVLVPPPPAADPAAPGSARTATPTKSRSATASMPLGAEPLYRQQREAQEAARRLLDERAHKKSERRLPMPGKAVTTSSFVHFF